MSVSPAVTGRGRIPSFSSGKPGGDSEEDVGGSSLRVEVQDADGASRRCKGKTRNDSAEGFPDPSLGGAERDHSPDFLKALADDSRARVAHAQPSLSESSKPLMVTPLPFSTLKSGLPQEGQRMNAWAASGRK